MPAGLFPVAAGQHFDAVGEHERRVESDAELADQRQVALRVFREPGAEELVRAAVGDRAQVLHQFVVRQADAGVADGQRPVVPCRVEA